ncbi:MAG TPA: FMN-binding protein [Clostridia bacterium]|nr:FMN-binding protein [Clostridia bacterium]
MKKGYLYTIIFMALVSLVLTSVLALSNAAFLPTIESNTWKAKQIAILDAFGVEAENPEDFFDTYVKEKSFGNLSGYELEGQEPAYAIPFEGAGLWGTIRGYLALSEDLSTILGITFTEQSETPGLGGRIEEEQFRDQFRQIELKALTYDDELQAITGATQTSASVLRIINHFHESVLPNLEVN